MTLSDVALNLMTYICGNCGNIEDIPMWEKEINYVEL